MSKYLKIPHNYPLNEILCLISCFILFFHYHCYPLWPVSKSFLLTYLLIAPDTGLLPSVASVLVLFLSVLLDFTDIQPSLCGSL